MEIFREVTPLIKEDCFTLFSRVKENFDFPVHTHEEYELNLIINAKNAKRIVGDHTSLIEKIELVLVGPNLPHAWFTENCTSKKIHEITIQFHRDLLDEKFLYRNQLNYMRIMFEKSFQGLLFSQEAINRISPRILGLARKSGFDSVLELLSILHDLSVSGNFITLSSGNINYKTNLSDPRVDKVLEFVNVNFNKEIRLKEMAFIANMGEVSFSRFFKSKTGRTCIDTLNEVRIGNATRLLISTSYGIAEIAYKCGFNNISNFNRVFKSKKGKSPKEYRNDYSGTRIFI